MIYKGIELEEYSGPTNGKLDDLTSKTFGDLFVICRAPKKGSNCTRYWVECTRCGTVYSSLSSHMRYGKAEACLKCAPSKVAEQKFEKNGGFGDISGGYWNDLKRGAAGEKSSRLSRKTRNFNITIKQAWELFVKQNGRCALSGVDIMFVKIGGHNKLSIKPTASLDRIDSNGDYTIDNVQWVHKDVNRMKNVFAQDYFIDMCKKISLTVGEI